MNVCVLGSGYADALVMHTEWRVYQNADFARAKELMRRPLIIDGRNVWSSYLLEEQGFEYDGIGVRVLR
jgi:UDPglucose 6-dehydrogenase